MTNIEPIQAFTDNYIWLLTNGSSAVVVDPGDPAPVAATLADRGLTLSGIIITHHHFDHVGGLETLASQWECPVWGPDNPAINGITHALSDGDSVTLLGLELQVGGVPGHTRDHIAFYAASPEPVLFCGDTLFAGGCGRVFEGTFPMMRQSLNKLAALPSETRVYCAHEYTMANLAFARAVEPANKALAQRELDDAARREQGLPTVPSTLAMERATNPFLRAGTQELRDALAASDRLSDQSDDGVFATVRSWKDNF